MSNGIGARWEEVWELLPRAMKGDEPEAVHAARVASRRLRAAMDGAADAFPKPWYRSLHKSAKLITRTLGHVRDQDVLLEKLVADREQAGAVERPGIDYLIERVTVERDDARAAMRDTFGRSRLRRARKTSRDRFPVPGKAGRRKRQGSHASSLPERARKQIEERVIDLFSYEPIIPDGDAVEELHDARIAVKRLRYTLELFQDEIGDESAHLIEDSKGLQEVLGQLHDLDVHIRLVVGELDAQREAVPAADPHVIDSLQAIVERDRRTRQDVHRAVVARWQGLMDDGFRERIDRVSAKW